MVYNILVVDDEQSIADLVELYLQNESYQVFKFYHGQEALDSLKKITPECRCGFCDGCFTERYPIPVEEENQGT